jgi:hypothetical protein
LEHVFVDVEGGAHGVIITHHAPDVKAGDQAITVTFGGTATFT